MPFQKGNKLAVGNPGPARRNFLTQELISQLNEIDPRTNKVKFGLMIEMMIKQAIGFILVEKIKDPKTGKVKIIEREIQGDLAAQKYIYERIEGSVKQTMDLGAGGEGGKATLTLVFEKDDEKL